MNSQSSFTTILLSTSLFTMAACGGETTVVISDCPDGAHMTMPDAGPADAALLDATPPEAGPEDASPEDASPEDAMIPDASPLTPRDVCTVICNLLIDCFAMMMPGVPPADVERAKMECVRGCSDDLLDCTPAQLDTIYACRERDCAGLMSCIMPVGCVDMGGGP